MKPEELKAIIDDHSKWLRGEGDKKANLEGADLREADLREADLRGADLRNSDLSGANLEGAKLATANLAGADLAGANLRRANLRKAKLGWADLREANLEGADLSNANLSWANLRRANLRKANLAEAKIDASICRMDFGGWTVCVYADRTSVGCEQHINEDWLAWTPESKEIKKMHEGASAWWKSHGKFIKAAIRHVMEKAKGGEA